MSRQNKVFEAINPATQESIRRVECDGPETVEEKIKRAQSAYKKWRQITLEERAQLLLKVAQILRNNQADHAAFMTEEMGKPKKEAFGEVEKAAWCAEHYAEHAKEYLKDEVIKSDSEESYVQYLPLGTILGILPWNAPYWLAFRFCAPALMAGNTCLMKPDSGVPGSAQAIQKAFEEAGAPEGVFQSLFTVNEDTEKVIRDFRIRGVSFTGSTRGGSQVASIAAKEIKPMVLELGGSDPTLVYPDADLEKATDVMTLSRVINAGQSCIAAKRLIIHEKVYDDVVELMKKKLGKLKVGDPSDESNNIGPIARSDLLENLDRQVQKTIEQGAKCLLGGKPLEGKGLFYPPTLLTDVTDQMCSFREEVFGPVASIIKATNEESMLEMANDTEYGLGASVWTADISRAKEIARNIETGQVSINGIVKTDPRLPSGGVKRSGIGRELGAHGIKEFTNAQQIRIS